MSTNIIFKREGKGFAAKVLFAMLIMTLFLACTAFTAQAATKLSTKKITMVSGKTKKVSLKGAKGNTVWASSNERVATVAKSGSKVKVTATGAGKAKITATNGGRQYTLTVKVNGVNNPGTLKPGKTVSLKAKKIGKKIKWTSSNPKVASVDKKSGRVSALKSGTAKITAKGTKGKAAVVIVVKADGSAAYNGAANKPGSPSAPSSTNGGNSSTPSSPSSQTYPVVSNKPKYHYEITVLNNGIVDGHESVIYNDPKQVSGGGGDAIQRGALLYIKTDAPAPYSLEGGGSWRSPAYTFLIDGKYATGNQLTAYPMANAHYESNGRAVGGDIVIIKAKTPGIHTIEIVEDIDFSWDGYLADDVLKSYTKTGVSIKINYHDYDAERDQWVAETVAKYTSPGMTDRQKAEALRKYFLSDRFHHYQIATDRNGLNGTSRYISYINYTPFWISGIGDCIESNSMFQRTLEKAGVTYKGAGSGTHFYTLVYLDGEWVNMDVAKSNLHLFIDELKFIN